MDFIDYLDEKFGFSTVEGGRQLKLEGYCPFCGENRGDLRVYVNIESGMGNCFHCGTGFGPVKFVMASEGCSKRQAEDILSEDHDGFVKDGGKAQDDAQELIWPSLVSIDACPTAAAYLANRGIHAGLIDRFKLCYSPNNTKIAGRLFYTHDRILIPIHDIKAQPVAWIARDITGRAKVKYLTTPGWDSNKHLFNAWGVPINPEYLIICEGTFDVFGWWRAGFVNVVATFGKKISDEQIELIRQINPKVAFIAWDTDALWKKFEFMERHGWRWPVMLVDLDGKDADEMSRAGLVQSISAARSYSWSEKILAGLFA